MLFVRMVKPNDIFLLFISELSSAQLRIDGCESEWVRAYHDVGFHLCHFHTFSLSLSFCFPFHENYANVENKLSPKTKLTHGVGHAVSHWLQNEKWWNSNFGHFACVSFTSRVGLSPYSMIHLPGFAELHLPYEMPTCGLAGEWAPNGKL